MKTIRKIAWILVIIGGLNWGLESFGQGIGNFLPDSLATTIYALVGISALIEIFAGKGKKTEPMDMPPAQSQM
ncbi:MAG: DUF378 domain-containing protein [Candidatus Zambryskibacteria bacterium]|nr:DUF378 domain-containing protein [Candidatus Zambryskibacteria bacterium]